jgi:hypothetical protein
MMLLITPSWFHDRKGRSKEMQLVKGMLCKLCRHVVFNIMQMPSARENICLPLFFVLQIMSGFDSFLV